MQHQAKRSVARWLAGGLLIAGATCVPLAFAGFVPGGGNSKADCYMGFDIEGVTATGGRVECTEGDPCDTGACGDAKCDFEFRICVNQPGILECVPPAGGLDKVNTPKPFASGIPPLLTGATCGSALSLEVKLKKNGQKSNKRVIRPRATATKGTKPRKDQDSFSLICKPRTGPCPASPSGAFLP